VVVRDHIQALEASRPALAVRQDLPVQADAAAVVPVVGDSSLVVEVGHADAVGTAAVAEVGMA